MCFFIDFLSVLGLFWEEFSNIVHCLGHPVSKCFLEGVQTFTYTDFGFVLGAFSEVFPACFQE